MQIQIVELSELWTSKESHSKIMSNNITIFLQILSINVVKNNSKNNSYVRCLLNFQSKKGPEWSWTSPCLNISVTWLVTKPCVLPLPKQPRAGFSPWGILAPSWRYIPTGWLFFTDIFIPTGRFLGLGVPEPSASSVPLRCHRCATHAGTGISLRAFVLHWSIRINWIVWTAISLLIAYFILAYPFLDIYFVLEYPCWLHILY